MPRDAEQRTCHAFGLLMIVKPRIPGLLQVARPSIRRFTERVFAEDRMAVEAGAAACGSTAPCDGVRLADGIRGQE